MRILRKRNQCYAFRLSAKELIGGDRMEIQVNGKKMSLEESISLEELVKKMDYDKRRIAAEVNLEIIDKEHYNNVMLKEGDIVEIVSFMGGGC